MKWIKSGRWYGLVGQTKWYDVWHCGDGDDAYFLYFGTLDSQQQVRTLEEAKAIVEAMYALRNEE